jgi:hypothetical protein
MEEKAGEMIREIDTDERLAVWLRQGGKRIPIPLVVVQIVCMNGRDDEAGQSELV